jgi:hypothetical protein
MRCALAAAALALAICGAASHAQIAAPGAQEQSAPTADTEHVAGLNDLNAITFECAKTALNAAAREAAAAPSRGTYQFAYFKIINDSHHSSYEVHFKSNHHGESDLKYCVAVYCQQGWNPATTRASVRSLGDARRPKGSEAHVADCGGHKPVPARRRQER